MNIFVVVCDVSDVYMHMYVWCVHAPLVYVWWCVYAHGVCMVVLVCVYVFWDCKGRTALDEDIISSHHSFLEATELKLEL